MGSLPPRKGKSKDQPDPGFDRWIGNQLHDLYDQVLSEPLPDDIARLIEQFIRRAPESRDGGPSDDSAVRRPIAMPQGDDDRYGGPALAPTEFAGLGEGGDASAAEPAVDDGMPKRDG